MFRKIHSNRDPRETLASELKKEFSVYFSQATIVLNGFCKKYPKPVYAAMVLLIIASMVLSFTLFLKRTPASGQKTLKVTSSPRANAEDGFGQILQKGAALKESIALQTQIEAILAKDSLTSGDRIMLKKSIDRLHALSIQDHKIN